MNDTYLTYSEYTSYGGTLSQKDFTLSEFKARKIIDYATDTRVRDMTAVPAAVKLCMMAVMSLNDKIGAEAQAESPTVTSFNTDGYSESYGALAAMAGENSSKAMNDVIRRYLYGETNDAGVPLLYRGVTL